jgi:hypothetical protein
MLIHANCNCLPEDEKQGALLFMQYYNNSHKIALYLLSDSTIKAQHTPSCEFQLLDAAPR